MSSIVNLRQEGRRGRRWDRPLTAGRGTGLRGGQRRGEARGTPKGVRWQDLWHKCGTVRQGGGRPAPEHGTGRTQIHILVSRVGCAICGSGQTQNTASGTLCEACYQRRARKARRSARRRQHRLDTEPDRRAVASPPTPSLPRCPGSSHSPMHVAARDACSERERLAQGRAGLTHPPKLGRLDHLRGPPPAGHRGPPPRGAVVVLATAPAP